MQKDVYQQSLELHKLHHGKIETISKVKLDTKEALSLAYTPGVAEVCREIARDPSLAREYTLKRNTIAIVSDGSAILGLGNLGALASIPVMEGKAAIFKEFAGVDAFPICLDTQDTEEIIKAVKQIAPVFGGINLEVYQHHVVLKLKSDCEPNYQFQLCTMINGELQQLHW